MKTLALLVSCGCLLASARYVPTPANASLDVVSNIKFINSTGNATVAQAISKANLVLSKKQFYDVVAQKDKFTYTIESPAEIADYLKNATLQLKVRLYEEQNNTTAYVSSAYPNTVFLNTASRRFKDNNSVDLASTLIHEAVHSVDATVEGARFGHGGNSADGKDQSAPYWIGDKAKCFAQGNTNCNAPQLTDNIDATLIIAEGEDLDPSLMRYK